MNKFSLLVFIVCNQILPSVRVWFEYMLKEQHNYVGCCSSFLIIFSVWILHPVNWSASFLQWLVCWMSGSGRHWVYVKSLVVPEQLQQLNQELPPSQLTNWYITTQLKWSVTNYIKFIYPPYHRPKLLVWRTQNKVISSLILVIIIKKFS